MSEKLLNGNASTSLSTGTSATLSNLITSGYRPIRNGDRFNHLFPVPDDKDKIIIRDGDVDETVELMKSVVWKYKDDTSGLAPLLKGDSLKETCENIWNFLCNHIQYRLDKRGLEQLRRPARLVYDRALDQIQIYVLLFNWFL